MKTVAAVLAAGRGVRFGSDKTQAVLGDKPVWRWSVDAYLQSPDIDAVVLVTAEDRIQAMQALAPREVEVITGGHTRQDSSRAALAAVRDAEYLLIHDAARPFVSQELIGRSVAAVRRSKAAAAALPVSDTIKEVRNSSVRTLDRSLLWAMQTPQGGSVELLRRAHAAAIGPLTDDMALIEALGVHPEIVMGEPNNFKITTPEDLERARGLLATPEFRTGIGYDIHPFSDDPARSLFLGGVHFPDHRALAGHSDADVLLHAATDALLGAAGLGDIGQHFPNTDARWKGEPSTTFLTHATSLLQANGWRIVNLDVTVIAESPKVMKRALEIRACLAAAMCVDVSRVSVKATTNEGLGSIGRGEGISAFATATIAEARSKGPLP